MRTTPLIILALALGGCSPDIIGDWVGTCEFNTFDFEMEIELQERDGEDLSGDAAGVLTVYNGGDNAQPVAYQGEMTGTKDGLDFEFELDLISTEGNPATVDIEGVWDKDKNEIEGECKSGGEDGDIELEFEG